VFAHVTHENLALRTADPTPARAPPPRARCGRCRWVATCSRNRPQNSRVAVATERWRS